MVEHSKSKKIKKKCTRTLTSSDIFSEYAYTIWEVTSTYLIVNHAPASIDIRYV